MYSKTIFLFILLASVLDVQGWTISNQTIKSVGTIDNPKVENFNDDSLENNESVEFEKLTDYSVETNESVEFEKLADTSIINTRAPSLTDFVGLTDFWALGSSIIESSRPVEDSQGFATVLPSVNTTPELSNITENTKIDDLQKFLDNTLSEINDCEPLESTVGSTVSMKNTTNIETSSRGSNVTVPGIDDVEPLESTVGSTTVSTKNTNKVKTSSQGSNVFATKADSLGDYALRVSEFVIRSVTRIILFIIEFICSPNSMVCISLAAYIKSLFDNYMVSY